MQTFDIRIVVDNDQITAAEITENLNSEVELCMFDDSGEHRTFVAILGAAPLVHVGGIGHRVVDVSLAVYDTDRDDVHQALITGAA